MRIGNPLFHRVDVLLVDPKGYPTLQLAPRIKELIGHFTELCIQLITSSPLLPQCCHGIFQGIFSVGELCEAGFGQIFGIPLSCLRSSLRCFSLSSGLLCGDQLILQGSDAWLGLSPENGDD